MPAVEYALDEDLKQRLRADLRHIQRDLTEASLAEALRLLDSPHFAGVTDQHIREVSEYRPIEIAGERFFERSFTPGKEAGAMLGFARVLGADSVRADLERLHASIHGAGGARSQPSPE